MPYQTFEIFLTRTRLKNAVKSVSKGFRGSVQAGNQQLFRERDGYRDRNSRSRYKKRFVDAMEQCIQACTNFLCVF